MSASSVGSALWRGHAGDLSSGGGATVEAPGRPPATSDREWEVLRLRTDEGMSFARISQQIGVSYTRTRQLHLRAVGELLRAAKQGPLQPSVAGQLTRASRRGNSIEGAAQLGRMESRKMTGRT